SARRRAKGMATHVLYPIELPRHELETQEERRGFGEEIDPTGGGIVRHGKASRSIRANSSGSRRKLKRARWARRWLSSEVPVRVIMPTSRAKRKTIWLVLLPWRFAMRASSGRAIASRLAVSREKPW